jgi:hypothetical protein
MSQVMLTPRVSKDLHAWLKEEAHQRRMSMNELYVDIFNKYKDQVEDGSKNIPVVRGFRDGTPIIYDEFDEKESNLTERINFGPERDGSLHTSQVHCGAD